MSQHVMSKMTFHHVLRQATPWPGHLFSCILCTSFHFSIDWHVCDTVRLDRFIPKARVLFCFFYSNTYSLGQAMSVLHFSTVVGLTACAHRTAERDTSIPCAFSLMHFRVRVVLPPSQDREHCKRDRMIVV